MSYRRQHNRSTERESALWLDLVNHHRAAAGNTNFLTSQSPEYRDCLRAVKQELKAGGRQTVPGRANYIQQTHYDDIVVAAEGAVGNGHTEEPTFVKRPKALLPSDIAVDEQFYSKLFNYNDLSESQKLDLEELKDMIHHDLYNDVERFDELPIEVAQNFIPDDHRFNEFVERLFQAYQQVARQPPRPRMRHLRKVYVA